LEGAGGGLEFAAEGAGQLWPTHVNRLVLTRDVMAVLVTAIQCVREDTSVSRVEVPAAACRSCVADGNRVTARWGGEQPEANCQSVGDEPVSA
jgi:hypothetical protein